MLFEGRDAAGKGGIIKAITERTSPRVFRVIALASPTEREKSQMYFQRYFPHLPAGGEVVLFDRSWYNRAGVERVMGFATEEQVQTFLKFAPPVERAIIASGVILLKYWLEETMEDQTERFGERINDYKKIWKLSPMDLESHRRWYDYSRARDAMFAATDSPDTPWYVVDSHDQKRGRLNCIGHLLSQVPYHEVPHDEVKLPKRQSKVDPAKGLSTAEAGTRLQKYGPNQMAAKKRESGAQAFIRQYKDFMQIILVAAAIVNLIATHQLSTTIVLLVLTVFNAVLGLRGESKAEASLAALEKMMKNITRVRRDGQAVEIEAEQLVPGDTDTIEKADAPLGDRHCMGYMNTAVTRGRGEMIVTTTGMGTEMGHIADLLNKTEADKTPLQKQLDRLTIVIAGLAGVAFILMVILGLKNGDPFDVIFTAGIALAISAIPTGMPAVVTTLYSMGTRTLAGQNAIVKRLPSVETLGSVSAICSDKTGTLTLNKMTAREFTIPGQNRFTVTGEGYGTQGTLALSSGIAGLQPWQKNTLSYRTEGKLLSAGGAKVDLDPILLPMALCADARLDNGALIGDPTEGALIVLAEKGGISVEGARQMYPRVAEVPFDSDYKFMATFHNMTNEQGKPVVRAFVKGAPDVLIARSRSYWVPDGEVREGNAEKGQLALEENERMARAGERVMVVARRDFDPSTFDPKGPAGDGRLIDLMTDLTMLAMVGIVDPPRAEAKAAIAKCHSAGIQVRMITGDHAVTAAAIGKELGITGKALTGAQFAAMSDEELKKELPDIGVVARVAPEDKIRLVRLLQEQSNIVAMTGDGVNDAPALKKADIGVAMGITGTEVSKGAAVMILTDDNFATIVKAVEFGRGIYDNLAKYVRFQMTALVAFIISYLVAAFFRILGGVPFTPLVVLWINFLVQVPLVAAMGFDSPAPGLMARKPRPLSQPVLSRGQWIRIIFIGFLVAVGTMVLEYLQVDPAVAATMGFVVFSLCNITIALSVRDENASAFNRELLSDRRQLMLFGLSLLLVFVPVELGFPRFLGLTRLNGYIWLICIGVAVAVLLVDEVIKIFRRRRLAQAKAADATVAVAGPAQAKLVEARGSRFTLLAGYTFVLLGFLTMLLLWQEGVSYLPVGLAYAFVGLGIGLAGTPASRSLTGSVPVTRVGMASGTADLQRDLGGAIFNSLFGAVLAAGYASAMAAAIAAAPEGTQVPASVASSLTMSYAGAQTVAAQYPEYASQITAAAKTSFLAGDQTAYIAGIIAVLIGAALVFLIFPKRDKERDLVMAYHQQDMASTAAEAGGPPDANATK